MTEFEGQGEESKPEETKTPDVSTKVPVVDLEEQFRAIFARLGVCSSSLAPLPENCSFTVCIELKDEVGVDPPIGHPQPWIPAQPSLQPAGKKAVEESEHSGDVSGGRVGKGKGSDLGGVKTTPVRTIEAGEFLLEMWIEEGKGKWDLQTFESSVESL